MVNNMDIFCCWFILWITVTFHIKIKHYPSQWLAVFFRNDRTKCRYIQMNRQKQWIFETGINISLQFIIHQLKTERMKEILWTGLWSETVYTLLWTTLSFHKNLREICSGCKLQAIRWVDFSYWNVPLTGWTGSTGSWPPRVGTVHSRIDRTTAIVYFTFVDIDTWKSITRITWAIECIQ